MRRLVLRVGPSHHRAGEPGHDGIESPFCLDKLDDFVIEEGGVGPHPHLADRVGQLGKGTLQQGNRNGRDVGGAGMVTALPTVLRVPFQAVQGKIGRSTALFRVVGHLGSFLATIDGQHRAVQIEDRLGRPPEHRCAPGVVQFEESVLPPACEAVEEAPQGARVGVTRQTGQIVKHAVVAQGLGGLDPAQAQDQRIKQRLQRFADAVAVVALSESDMPLQCALQMDALEELLDQSYSAELSQADSIGGNAKILGSSTHCCRTAFLVKLCNKD